MMLVKAGPGAKTQKHISVDGKEALVYNRLAVKGDFKEIFEGVIKDTIFNLELKEPLTEQVKIVYPYNLMQILRCLYPEKAKDYFKHFINKQLTEHGIATVETLLSETLGDRHKNWKNDSIKDNAFRAFLEDLLDEGYRQEKYRKLIKFIGDQQGYYCFSLNGIVFRLSRSGMKCKGNPWEHLNAVADIIKQLNDRLANRKSLADCSKVIGATNVVNVVFTLWPKEAREFFQYYAKQFTERRKRINLSRLMKETLGIEHHNMFRLFNKNIDEKVLWVKEQLEQIVNEEYRVQCNTLVATNREEMRFDNYVWNFYWLSGPSLRCTSFDFNSIRVPEIRGEYMLYMRHQLWTHIGPPGTGKYTTTIIGIHALCEINPNIKRFLDVRKTDIRALKTYLETTAKTEKGNPLRISTIARVFIYLREITNFLIEYYLKLAQKDKRYQKSFSSS